MAGFRPIDLSEWNVENNCDLDAQSRNSIVAHIDPLELTKQLCEQAKTSFRTQSKQRTVASYIETCSDKSDYARHCFIVAIESEDIFNQFFNGRCGYRAMYHRSPAVGKAYNDATLESLFPYLQRETQTSASLRGCSTKIWPFFENRFFPASLAIPKWRTSPMGLAAFNPHYPTFVIKGSFLNDRSEEYDPKPNRDEQLHTTGHT